MRQMDDATNKPADHVATATQETDADKPGRGFLDVLAEAVAIKEAGHMPGPASDGTEVPGAVRAPGPRPAPTPRTTAVLKRERAVAATIRPPQCGSASNSKAAPP